MAETTSDRLREQSWRLPEAIELLRQVLRSGRFGHLMETAECFPCAIADVVGDYDAAMKQETEHAPHAG